MRDQKLSPQEITAQLQQLTTWQLHGEEITRLFTFEDFVEAMKFVNKVAGLAESANHHPDIKITWNKVALNLTTHDSGGLTWRDFDLAGKIDKLI
jgi:4a-hydroxytetrahydrobiopterin dehydratase